MSENYWMLWVPVAIVVLVFLIRRTFVRSVETPVVGQIWKSAGNGDRIYVNNIRILRSGDVGAIYCRALSSGDEYAVPDVYAFGLSHWRSRIRDERMFLVVDAAVNNA